MNKVNEQIWNLLVLLKEPKRTRQHAINNTNQSHSALQNGRNGLIWFVAADAALCGLWIVSEMSNSMEQRRLSWIVEFGLPFFGWVMGGSPPMAPPKGSKRNQTNSTNSIQQRKRKRMNKQNSSLNWLSNGINFINGMEQSMEKSLCLWMGPQGVSRRGKWKQLNLSFVGPLCAIKKKEESWFWAAFSFIVCWVMGRRPLCAAELHSIWFHNQIPFHHLCLQLSLPRRRQSSPLAFSFHVN